MNSPTTSTFKRYLVNSKPFATQAEAIAEATTMLATGGSLTITPIFDKHGYLEAKAIYKLYQEYVTEAAFVMSTTAARPMHPDADLMDMRRRYQAAKQGKLVQAEIARLRRHVYNEQYAMRQVSSTHKQAWQRQLDLQATLTRIKHLTTVLSDWPQFGADHLPIVAKEEPTLEELRVAEYQQAAVATYNMPAQPELLAVDWTKTAPIVERVPESEDDLLYALKDAEFTTKQINTLLYETPKSIGDVRLNRYRESLKRRDRLDNQLTNSTLSYSWNPAIIEHVEA